MPIRSSKPGGNDLTTKARRIVERTVGKKLDGFRVNDPNSGKNPAAVALGKLSGRRVRARAAALSLRRRKAIARWMRQPHQSGSLRVTIKN